MNPRIKICCIQNKAEAQLAIDHGADVLGLVGAMPSGPGPINDDRIAGIAQWVPLEIDTFLLTSETDPEAIIAHHRRTRTRSIQLVDAVANNEYDRLRAALPGVKLVQVIHVTGAEAVNQALEVAPYVDMLLMDSGNPGADIKELGGTGRTHNWDISREIVAQAGIPVFLAGGLNAGNVRSAMDHVRPFGVDLCSGVRTQGALDPHKLKAFVDAVKS